MKPKSAITKAILGSALLLFAGSLQAQTTYTYIGTSDNNGASEWNEAVNWDTDPNRPGSNFEGAVDDIVIIRNNLGSGEQEIRVVMDVGTIGNLTVGGQAAGSGADTELMLRSGGNLVVTGLTQVGDVTDGNQRGGRIEQVNNTNTLRVTDVVGGSTDGNNRLRTNQENVTLYIDGEVDTAAVRSGLDGMDANLIDFMNDRGTINVTDGGPATLNFQDFQAGNTNNAGGSATTNVGTGKVINPSVLSDVARNTADNESNRSPDGTLNINGGTLNFPVDLRVGSLASGSGTNNHTTGTLNVGDGVNGGALNVSGILRLAVKDEVDATSTAIGILNVADGLAVATLENGIELGSAGNYPGTTATVNVSAGLLKVSGKIEDTVFSVPLTTNPANSAINVTGGELQLLDYKGGVRDVDKLTHSGGIIDFLAYQGMPAITCTDADLAAGTGSTVYDITGAVDAVSSTTDIANWDGDTDLDWDVGTNWDTDSVPAASAGVIATSDVLTLIDSANAITAGGGASNLDEAVIGASDGGWTLAQTANTITITRTGSGFGAGVAKAVINTGDIVTRGTTLNVQNASGQGADASELDVLSGGLDVTGDLLLGGASGGIVNQTDGDVTISGNITAGAVGGSYFVDGSGILDVQGGSITVQRFAVGETASSTGDYSASNMTITTNGDFTVGELGDGILDLTDSTIVVGTGCFNAEDAASSADITLFDSTLTANANEFRVAGLGEGTISLNGTSSITHDGGEFVISDAGSELDPGSGTLIMNDDSSLTLTGGNLEVAENAYSNGTLDMDTTGTLTINNNNLLLSQAVNSTANLNLVNGTIDLRPAFANNNTHGNCGPNDGDCTVTMEGGTIHVGNDLRFTDHAQGISRWTQTGGEVLVGDDLLYRGNGDDQMDLSGTATLKVGQEAGESGNLDMDDASTLPGGNRLTLRGHQVTVEAIASTTGSNLICDGDSTLAWELNDTGASAIKVGNASSGTVTLNGCVAAFSFDGTTPPSGTHTLIDNQGLNAVVGTFSGLNEGALIIIGGSPYQISYMADLQLDSAFNDVVLTSVTDPLVSIAGDGPVTEGGTAGWTVSTPVAPSGYNIIVDIIYEGSASEGTDYTGVATATILAGEETGNLDVVTSSDTDYEGCETIVAVISNISASTGTPTLNIGSPDAATVLLLDGPSQPVASNLEQVSVGSGAGIDLKDIVVIDADATYESTVTTANTAYYHLGGVSNVSTFASPAILDDDSSFDLDLLGPELNDAAGMSLELQVIPQAADLTVDGVSRLIWEMGGTTNGSQLVFLDGIPHFLSKCNAPADTEFPVNDNTVPGAFQDLDWAVGDTIVVPLTTSAVAVGEPLRIAIDYNNALDTVTYSVNGGAVVVKNLVPDPLDLDGNTNWNGDHTTDHGVIVSQIGGTTSEVGSPFEIGTYLDLAGGTTAISCLSFWNQSGTGVTNVGGTTDTITATLQIVGWVDETLTGPGLTNNGSGNYSVSGGAGNVNTALAAMQFNEGSGTGPYTIDVSIDDGGTPITGKIYIVATAPDPIYVSPGFGTNFLDPIADGDAGAAGPQAATFGVDAFDNITDALAAADPATGTVIVNDGTYLAPNAIDYESVFMVGTGQTLRITDADEVGGVSTVTVHSLDAVRGTDPPALPGNSIDLDSNTLVVGDDLDIDLNAFQIDCPIIGTGNLTKDGADRLILREVCTYTGTTTIEDGFLRIGHVGNVGDPLLTDYQGQLDGDGPVVINIVGATFGGLELNPNIDTTMTQTGAISGDGSVILLDDGTVVFDGPAANPYSGGTQLGDSGGSTWDGSDPASSKNGFVLIGRSDHLGTGTITMGGHQIQASVGGLNVTNDIIIGNGGMRFGGSNDLEMSGDILSFDASRGTGNYGPEDGTTITLSGSINLEDALAAAVNLTMDGNPGTDNRTMVFSGPITGLGNIVLNGDFDDGDLIVTDLTSDYAGLTTINNGTLQLDGAHTGGGAYTVAAAGTLGGDGSTDADVTVAGTLAPGASIGTLATGNLMVTGTLSLEVDNTTGGPGVGHDQVVVTGTVDITGATLEVIEGAGVEITPGAVVVIDNDAFDAIVGVFGAGVPFSGDYLGSGQTGQVLTFGGSGNDLSLLAAGPSIIGAWRGANFAGDFSNSGPGANTANPDSDSSDNLLEFGFGIDPTLADSASLVAGIGGTTVPGGPVVDTSAAPTYNAWFMRRTDAGSLGSAAYSLEICSDFTDWEDLPLGAAVVLDTVGSYELVQVAFPPLLGGGAGAVPQFLRVHVTEIVSP